MAKNIIVIGGSAAGPKAAAKARRMDEHANITIIQKGAYLSMASCGYPYYVGGVFDDRNQLISTPTGVVRDPSFFMAAKGIEARTKTEVTSIDREKKIVHCRNLDDSSEYQMDYDVLIITTGSVPNRPPIPGIDLKGITTLQSMEDADYLRKVRDAKEIKKAVVVGGGLIGVETCEALHLAGIQTTVIERLPQLLTFLDNDIAALVENHIRANGINVMTNAEVASFIGEDGVLKGIKLANGTELTCDLAVMAAGVRPNSKLAADSGLKVGPVGGIQVDEYMRTSDENIYAAGDCVEIPNIITGKSVHAPYGDLANLQGRVAGKNAVCGAEYTFPGTTQTGICKILEYTAGVTGLSEKAAKEAGMDYIKVINAGPDKPGFMTGMPLITKLLADKNTGKILGAQCVGTGDVSRQIATWATALMGKLTIDDMVNADFPYAPPFSLAIDHSIATTHLLQNKQEGRLVGLTACEAKVMIAKDKDTFVLDVRGPDEYEAMRLGIGERLIPLGKLRNRLGELPIDKETPIICFCKISLRGYEASLILKANGWKNVYIMEGGIVAWPYPREK